MGAPRIRSRRPFRVLVLAVVWVALAAAGLSVLLVSPLPDRHRDESVLDGRVASGLIGWVVAAEADQVTMERITGIDGPRRADAAVELRRSGDSGAWAFLLAGLARPDEFFRIGRSYRMQLYVRDLNASGRPVTLRVTNGAADRGPTDASVTAAFTDRDWHLLTRTFVATGNAFQDTALYLALPPDGPLHWQATLASVRRVDPG
ncbi:hypothetical protein [Cryptosporangium aurantiacum]|uniref:Carbohydrate binding domain-containing protein n=1 Tax=Cryptosporangium aurantiacum TaxID=134849 RepID=A0A1M7IF77_9ACTN|nr:hypothetical protein [Cryptosporangium aurantiacum]SHM39424.1 hypothetical protein SAMN05443668_101478 [Cryptosporangium aurantiacum]